jgi:hypothetical protein
MNETGKRLLIAAAAALLTDAASAANIGNVGAVNQTARGTPAGQTCSIANASRRAARAMRRSSF